MLRDPSFRAWRLVCLLCLWLPATLSAGYQFDVWTSEQGLPHNSIRAVLQTRDGYLWLATGGGLARFDGVRFRTFHSGNTPGITSDRYTFALLEARDGALWAGTLDAGALRYKDGVFTTVTANEGLPGNHVLRIDEDPDGNVWIFTRGGLARWSGGRLVRVAPMPGSEFNSALREQAEHVGDDGKYLGLWRQTAHGWQRFAWGVWSDFPVPPDIRSPQDLAIRSIFEDSARRIWYSLLGRPGEYYSVAGGRLKSYKGLPPDSFVFYEDRERALWLSDHDARTATWKNGRLQPLSGLASPTMMRVIEDRDGGTWITTLNEGLFRKRRQIVTSFRHHSGREFGATLLEDRNGRVWIGGLGLMRHDEAGGHIYRRRPTSRWNPNFVSALFEDRDGALWVGFREGAARFKDGRFLEEPDLAAIGKAVFAIHRTSNGDLWFGCEDGLVRRRGGALQRYTTADGLASDHITALLEDRSGRLWIGTQEGLHYLEEARFSTVRGPQGGRIGAVQSLHEDDAGVLWVGTDGYGLFRIGGDRVTCYTAQHGLGSNNIVSVLEDGRGSLWLGTNIGLVRVAKRDLEEKARGKLAHVASSRYTRADGLLNTQSAQLGQPAALKDRNGKLWFSLLGGVAVVDPGAVSVREAPPPVFVEDCLVEEQTVPCGNGIVMKAGQHNLEIQYGAIEFDKPGEIRFRFRLAGLEEEWTEAGGRRTAWFTHLPPGEYTFQVTAATSGSIWNPDGPSIPVVVLPPFYATWWFRSLAVLAATAAVALAWQRRVAALNRVHALQQAFSRQLIETQENERKRIAAELHDSLGQRLTIISNLALFHLREMSSNGGRTEQISEIAAEASLAMREVREISYALRPYQLDRLGLTRAVEAAIRNAGAASSVEFSSSIENIDDVLPADSRINFYRIVQECLNNIVKHSQATQADVTVWREDGRLLLTVADNGRGFTPAASSAEPRSGGFGLIGISERARLLGGRASIQSTPGRGVQVLIEIDLRASRNGR